MEDSWKSGQNILTTVAIFIVANIRAALNLRTWLLTYQPAMLPRLFKRELVNYRVETVTTLSKFDPRGGTHHFIGDEAFTACETEQKYIVIH